MPRRTSHQTARGIERRTVTAAIWSLDRLSSKSFLICSSVIIRFFCSILREPVKQVPSEWQHICKNFLTDAGIDGNIMYLNSQYNAKPAKQPWRMVEGSRCEDDRG